MKLLIIIIIAIFPFTAAFSQPGFDWAQACGHPFYGETKSVLTTDTEGNIFMAGSFIETAVFGAESITSAGGTDIYIAKHNAAGDVLWLLGDGGADYDYIHDISVDDNGIYTCGSFYGTINIGSETFVSQGSQDIFVSRYDSEGNFLWAKHAGSPKTDYINALATDPYGNMLVTGHYYDSIAFGDTTIYSAGASDIFLAKYNATGELIWLRQAGGSSSDQSYSISCDNDGNIIFTGSFFYDLQVGDTLLTTTDPTGVFMARFNNEGVFQYAIQVDGNGLSAQSFAAFDNTGDIFFTGNFTDQVKFGPYLFDAGAFNIDIFITKHTANGELLWADHGYGAGSDQLKAVAGGPLNDLYITGHFLDTIHFSDLTLDYTLCCGSAEIFMIRYTEDGSPAWGDQITGERGMVESMCKNASDELFVSGMFQFDLAFGDIIIQSSDSYSSFLTGVATGTYTSIDEFGQEQTLKVYPIPAGDRLYFELPAETSGLSYEFIDMTGRRLLEGSTSGSGKLDISGIPAGQYLLRVYSAEEGISESGIILKR